MTYSTTLKKTIFSKESILKCLYWYSANFNIKISDNNEFFKVTITPKNKISKESFDSICDKLERDFIDFNLRQIVKNETDDIRKILIAKALSNHDILDVAPPGSIEDPLGFDVEKV